MGQIILEANRINTFYGSSHILFDVSFQIASSEVVALLGRNGAGKTTMLRSIMGLTRPKTGEIKYKGINILGMRPFKIARLGMGYVPEDRLIFPDLTVMDNLKIAFTNGSSSKREWNLERVFKYFPLLEERWNQKGGTLSGGEQQMLTIARTLMASPDLLLIDEPTEGLSPLFVKEVRKLVLAIAATGSTIILSEQNIKFSLNNAQRIYIIETGKIKYEGSSEELNQNQSIIKKYLAV